MPGKIETIIIILLAIVFYIGIFIGTLIAIWFFFRSCIVSALKRYDKLKMNGFYKTKKKNNQ